MFFYPLLSKCKNCIIFRIIFCCIISFRDIDIEILPNGLISIEFPWFRNPLFCKNTWLNFQSRSQSDSFLSWWTASLEKYWFCSSLQSLDSQKVWKSANCKDFYRYLNIYFSITTSLIYSIKVPIENLTFTGWFGCKTKSLWSFIKISL